MAEVQITEEDFETFKEAYLGYVKLFELSDYNHIFQHAPLDEAAATVQIEADGRCCIISLCTECPDHHITEDSMEEWARHEATHVLLADLCNLLRDPAVSEQVKHRAEESLVVKLDSIFKYYQG